MSADATGFPAPDSSPRGEPLVPLLRAEQGLADPDALATWHAALSNALSQDIPHDLLGLWLYPWHGGVVLLGPEALAQDELAVPLPSPQVEPGQVQLLEDIVRDAGYRSVACVPVRAGRRDVGLMLAADLRPDRYGESERMTLEVAAHRLAPMLGRMARQWGGSALPAKEAERLTALVDAVGAAGRHGGSAQVYLAELSRALEPMLPHDALELLLADTEGARAYRMGEHNGSPLWSDPSLVIAREHLDLASLFGPRETVLIADSYQEPRWPRGYFTVDEPVGAEIRSVVGARIRLPGGGVAYLLAGGIGADLYGEADADLLRRVGGLIAAQVAVLVTASALSSSPAAPQAPKPSLLEAAELLATGTEFAERRPLPDLPLVPVAGTTLAAVLQGEIPSSFQLVEDEARLLVPLRVAGRIHGALVLTARPPALLREAHLPPAQQLADIVAAHLELLRRTALLPPPYMPGWKKVR